MPNKSALLCLDLINDIAHPEGKIGGERGYAKFAEEHNTIKRIARIQEQFRQQGHPVIHVRVQFSEGYPEIYKNSKIYAPVTEKQALLRHTWGTEFLPEVAPEEHEAIITKHRISAFFRTRLELILSSLEIKNLYLCGVSTNLAINTTVREAHDRDFNTYVLADACIDTDTQTHASALMNMGRFTTVTDFADVALKLAK